MRYSRDLPGQLDVTPAGPKVVVGIRDHVNGHAIPPHVDARAVILNSWQLADLLHYTSALGERLGAQERDRTFADQTPVLDALGLVELAWCDLIRHARLLVTEPRCKTVA